jgi:hypothetical protein
MSNSDSFEELIYFKGLLFYFILINKRDIGKDEDEQEVPETDRFSHRGKFTTV